MKNRYESAGSEAAEKEKLIMRLGRYIKRLMDRYKYNENKKVFAFYMILHAMVVLTGIRCFLTQNYENVLVCILALILFLAPAFTLLCKDSGMGYNAAYDERISLRSSRLFSGLSAEQRQ